MKLTAVENKVEITLMDHLLKIEQETIDINGLEPNKRYITNLKSKGKEEVLLKQEIGTTEDGEKEYIVVYTNSETVNCVRCTQQQLYNCLVKVKNRLLHARITKKKVKLTILAYVVNDYGLEIGEQKFYINSEISQPCKLKVYPDFISKATMILDGGNIHTYTFDLDTIVDDESAINGVTRYTLNVNGYELEYKIRRKFKFRRNTKLYYVPMKPMYTDQYAIHFRRTFAGTLRFVKRMKEPIEDTRKFRLLESKPVSFVLYYLGRLLSYIRIRKINIFYEKFASKSEEGVYELYQKCNNSKRTKNFFVIDENSPDYERIKSDKHVLRKYSFKYYWYIYNCSWFIGSEAPSHLNILRSNNPYFRKATVTRKFVFLQHGIIYMKNLGVTSVFGAEREAGANYFVVSSEKEKQVVMDMLGYQENQLLKTGLGMYSKVPYNSINNDSEDYITVMLTWKDYEEQIEDFETSSYYKNTIEICEMLKKYIDASRIILIAHPKAYLSLSQTDLKDTIWSKPISEALSKTKLLITDYSSICYNAFYRGAGVIFYQPDLDVYEKEDGKLIPSEEEYVGKRAFDIEALENIIKETVKNKTIDLTGVRNKEHEKQYALINEFHDGKNIDRIYEELYQRKIV